MPEQPTFVLCPGQGAQHIGMGKRWAEQYPAAAQTFASADQVLGFALSELCFVGPQDELDRTDVAQVAIYTTSVACFNALTDTDQIGALGAAAGLSLGEFTALHLAGAFDFAEGLRLVQLRGQAMQAAAQQSKSSMVAVTGEAAEDKVEQLCAQARGDDVLVPANYNSPLQVVISGGQDACIRALVVADEMGFKAKQLSVAGAFHSTLMQPAAQRLAAALDQVEWQPLKVPVISNVTAQPHQDPDSIKRSLVDQLTSPVRWSKSMVCATQNHEFRYVELAPGKTLSGLMRRIVRGIKVQSFAEPPD